jgi:hypothetical protein
VSPGDGSTIPDGSIQLFEVGPPPGNYNGGHAAGSITLTGPGGNVSNYTTQWYATANGYFTSLLGGSKVCFTPEGSSCGACSGGFNLSLFATQGAIDGS